MEKGWIDFSEFKNDTTEASQIKLRSIRFHNYKVFDDYYLDFSDNNSCKNFACFIGSNGSGKTTILDCIQMIFSKYDSYEEKRLVAKLGRSVRHTSKDHNGIYDDSNFLISADIMMPNKNYTVEITKNGFIKDHPPEVKDIMQRICFYARFDFELHQFQLNRSKWLMFKELFESVTGFEIEEKSNVFDLSQDPIQAKLLNDYVLGFFVHKPNEIISNNECSAGEKKIIKSFSTLLNKDYIPPIILVDNIEMHVESGRHIYLIESMKKCFPNSQLFTTTHSYQISRNFGDRSQIYDLRFINTNELIRKEPWRLYLIDEVKDYISKLKSIIVYKELTGNLIEQGERILKKCYEGINGLEVMHEAKTFINEVSVLYLNDIVMYHNK